MPYEIYKLLHLAAIFVFLTSASVLLIAKPQGVFWKALTGVSSLVILVAGFGLLARLGGGNFPAWAQAKVVIWVLVTGLGHMVMKRFPAQATRAFWATVALAIGAAYIAIYKPGA